MAKTIEKNHGHHAARGARLQGAGRPVLLRYAIARCEDNNPKLFRVPLKSGEEALPVFSSRRAAQSFVYSNAFGWEWYTKEFSSGELVSLLLGPYLDVEWVLLDPPPAYLATEYSPANLMRWESFIDYLLG
ncbi:MAG: hypothetical protein QOI57_2756 [Rubrobacteraceae bacterium]|nr:hypothetical protein [Rubrobacteraceae bacterium]